MNGKIKKAFDPVTESAAPVEAGLRIVKGLGVPPRSRQAGVSKYDIGSLEVGDAFVSSVVKDIRNVTVAARAYAKRLAGNGEVARVFVTRKTEAGEYALIRES